MQKGSEEKGYYRLVFYKSIFAEELLLPMLVYDYLKVHFHLGKKRGLIRRTTKYQIKTYGDLTFLALAATILKRQYSLGDMTESKDKRKVRMLASRFSDQEEYPEFNHAFVVASTKLFDCLVNYVKRRIKTGELDVRRLFLSEDTLDDMLHDRQMRRCLHKAQVALPSL